MKRLPVQKQTAAGHWTRFKSFGGFGDYNGYVGLGAKCSKVVAIAIRGASILAKLSVVPVWRGYRGHKTGKPHTVLCKVTGYFDSHRWSSSLPRRHWHRPARVPKKLLLMAGMDDYCTSARGCIATLGSFAKATFDAIFKTCSYLNPDFWKKNLFTKIPDQELTDHLVETHTRVSVQRTQTPAVAT
ncbi:rCG33966, partial [Rattus norvegicus]